MSGETETRHEGAGLSGEGVEHDVKDLREG
jgi:hypothetical protein